MEIINKVKEFGSNLVKNGTGVSIKSYFLLEVSILGGIILLCVAAILLYDGFIDGKVDSSVSDIATLITSISGLFVAAGLPKIVGELKERNNNKKEDV